MKYVDEKQKNRKKKTENEIDEALKESFPASDPPSWSPGAASKNKGEKDNNKNR